MSKFSTRNLVLVAVALSAAMVAALVLRPQRKRPDDPVAVDGLSFAGISAPWASYGSLKVHRELGMELRVGSFGSDQVAVACDRETYWFWMRSYDPRRYHFCPLGEVGRVGLNPLFSPLFIRCASGAEFIWRGHPQDGEKRFSEGGFEVVASFRGGRMISLSYSAGADGSIVAEVLSHQKVGAFWIPRKLRVLLEGGDTVDVDMGDVEANPAKFPDATPPEGMKGSRLAVRR